MRIFLEENCGLTFWDWGFITDWTGINGLQPIVAYLRTTGSCVCPIRKSPMNAVYNTLLAQLARMGMIPGKLPRLPTKESAVPV